MQYIQYMQYIHCMQYMQRIQYIHCMQYIQYMQRMQCIQYMQRMQCIQYTLAIPRAAKITPAAKGHQLQSGWNSMKEWISLPYL